jgi:hypothetical protein
MSNIKREVIAKGFPILGPIDEVKGSGRKHDIEPTPGNGEAFSAGES